jgi:hypothetical protein
MPMTCLGAGISMSHGPLYATYINAATARVDLFDQQLAA